MYNMEPCDKHLYACLNTHYNSYYAKNVFIMTQKGSEIALLTYSVYGSWFSTLFPDRWQHYISYNHFFLKESSFTSLCTKLGTLYFLQPDFCLPDQTETRKLLGILPSMSGNARWSLQTPCTSPPPPTPTVTVTAWWYAWISSPIACWCQVEWCPQVNFDPRFL